MGYRPNLFRHTDGNDFVESGNDFVESDDSDIDFVTDEDDTDGMLANLHERLEGRLPPHYDLEVTVSFPSPHNGGITTTLREYFKQIIAENPRNTAFSGNVWNSFVSDGNPERHFHGIDLRARIICDAAYLAYQQSLENGMGSAPTP